MGCEEYKGTYRLIDPETHKITSSRDVVFFEYGKQTMEEAKAESTRYSHFSFIEKEKNENENANEETKHTLEGSSTVEEISDSEINVEDDTEIDEVFQDAENERAEQPAKRDRKIPTTKRKQPSKSAHQPRRSERQRKAKVLEDFVSYYTVQDRTDEPETTEEALEGHDKKLWLQAMNEEYKALKTNNTWELVQETGKQNVLTTKWVYRKKTSQTGEKKYKARLVVRGCAQKEGIDYNETFSLVVQYTSVRYLISLAVRERL